MQVTKTEKASCWVTCKTMLWAHKLKKTKVKLRPNYSTTVMGSESELQSVADCSFWGRSVIALEIRVLIIGVSNELFLHFLFLTLIIVFLAISHISHLSLYSLLCGTDFKFWHIQNILLFQSCHLRMFFLATAIFLFLIISEDMYR